jgi:hypothetical protein
VAALARLKLPARETARNRLLLARAERVCEESLARVSRARRQSRAAGALHLQLGGRAGTDEQEQIAAAWVGLSALIEMLEAEQSR